MVRNDREWSLLEGEQMLLIIGIISIIAGVLSFLYGMLNRHGYYHMLDGDGDKYTVMYRRMIIFTVISVILAVVGAICIAVFLKM